MLDTSCVRASRAALVLVVLGAINGGLADPRAGGGSHGHSAETSHDEHSASDEHGTGEHGDVTHGGDHAATNGHGDSHGGHDDAGHGAHDDAHGTGHDAATHDEHAGGAHGTSEHGSAGHDSHEGSGDDHGASPTGEEGAADGHSADGGHGEHAEVGEDGEVHDAAWHAEHDRGHNTNDPHGSGGHDGVKGHEDGHGHERIVKDLLTTFIIWVLIWFSGRLAILTGLSPLLFYLLLGCVMGNIHLHILDMAHSDFLHTLAVLAIAIVFFALGLEENVGHFMDGIKKAWGIASIGAAVPFCIGLGCTTLFWPDAPFETALMGGLAVTATAVSLTMISLKSEGLAQSRPAIGIMTSAVLDDIASLAMVAICVPIATGAAAPSVLGICWTVGKAILFFVVVAFVHVFIFPDDKTTGPGSWIPGLRNWGLKKALSWRGGEQAQLIALSVGMAWSMVAVGFGFHPAIGAYMGGLIIEHDYFAIDAASLETLEVHHRGTMDNRYHAVLEHVETVAYSWLGPFFFVELGSTVLIDENVLGVLGYSVLFFVLLFIGQFVSAAGAAKFVPGGFNWAEAGMIGFGMMGRAELFFVVLDLCYNQNDIMTKDMFCCFAITAMLMNVSVPVCISLYKKTYVKYTDEFELDEETGKIRQVYGSAAHGHGGHDDDEETGKDHGHHGHDDKANAREVKVVEQDYDHIDKKDHGAIQLDDVDVDVDNKVDAKTNARLAKQEQEAANGAQWVPNGQGGTTKVDNNGRQDHGTPKTKKNSVVLPMVCGCINSPANK